MVSERIAAVLLAVALRRWPAELRDDLRREWWAELHVLAEQQRHGQMVRYSLSLAMARPARRSVPVGVLLTGAWQVARLVLVAPLITMVLLATSFVAMNVIVTLLYALPFAMDLQLPLVTLLTLGSGVLMARLGRRWALTGKATVLAATIPGLLLSVAGTAALGGADKVARHGPAIVVFFVGLGGVLVVVRRLASAGRRRAAWCGGILGAILVADVAVTLPVFAATGLPGENPHPASAPVWLFTALTDSGFGLPSPTGMQIFLIVDEVELDPWLYLVFTALALGTVIAGSRPGDAVALDDPLTATG